MAWLKDDQSCRYFGPPVKYAPIYAPIDVNLFTFIINSVTILELSIFSTSSGRGINFSHSEIQPLTTSPTVIITCCTLINFQLYHQFCHYFRIINLPWNQKRIISPVTNLLTIQWKGHRFWNYQSSYHQVEGAYRLSWRLAWQG